MSTLARITGIAFVLISTVWTAGGVRAARPAEGDPPPDKPLIRYEMAAALDRVVRSVEADKAKSEALRAALPGGAAFVCGDSLRSAGRLAADSTSKFSDVPKTHWAYAAIQDLLAKKILLPSARFEGAHIVSRLELATALYRMAHYLDPDHVPAALPAGDGGPAPWLVSYGYLANDSALLIQPRSDSVLPTTLADSMAYVVERILFNRAGPGDDGGNPDF